ncbi:MAG: hypothetical protein ACUVX9_09495 [Anaerolineae bacterium]
MIQHIPLASRRAHTACRALPGALLALTLLAGSTGVSTVARAEFVPMTVRVSVASDGAQANGTSYYPAISSEGRHVVFASYATNLVPGDTNGKRDVFIHDRQTGQTTRVSVASDGTQGNGDSTYMSISADGRYVAFVSDATNLVPADTNGLSDVFVRDAQAGQTTRVSVASDGAQANGVSLFAAISADGRYVAFVSGASNLVPGDTNARDDVFLHDRQTGQTTRVSVASDGTQGNGHCAYAPAISADGRYVAFQSGASNLAPGDTNGQDDVFVHDVHTGQTARISVASDGTQGNGPSGAPSIAAEGHLVTFHSYASNLVASDTNGKPDVFVHDRQTGQTTRVSVASDGTQGNADSYYPTIAAEGRFVAYLSYASNLVAGDANSQRDVFQHDLQTGQTIRISVAADGLEGNGACYPFPSLSATGRWVAFVSYASNLVPGDTNGSGDIFVYDRWVSSAPWDVNLDGVVDIGDMGKVGLRWGETGLPCWIREDVNCDGVIDIGDIGLIGLHWGEIIS